MPMSGPIVRSGPTPEFSKNWDAVFGGKKTAVASKPAGKAASAKKVAKKSPQKTAKKVVKKSTKK